jgi:hypothetical protein
MTGSGVILMIGFLLGYRKLRKEAAVDNAPAHE